MTLCGNRGCGLPRSIIFAGVGPSQLRLRNGGSSAHWFAFIVPAGTPKDIIALLHREIVKMLALPEIKERMAALGFEAVGNTPDECAAQLRAESARWAKILRDAGIKAH